MEAWRSQWIKSRVLLLTTKILSLLQLFLVVTVSVTVAGVDTSVHW